MGHWSSAASRVAVPCAAAVSAVLLTLEVLNGAAHHNYIAVLPCTLLAVGLVLTAIGQEWPGVALGGAGLGTACFVPPALLLATLWLSPLLVLALVFRDRRKAALAVGAAGVAASLWMCRRAPGPVEWMTAIVAWLAIYAVAAGCGFAVQSLRAAERRELDQSIARQRRAIAAELHDNVAHELSLIVMRAEVALVTPDLSEAELRYIAAAGRRANAFLRGVIPLLDLEPTRPYSLPGELERAQTVIAESGRAVHLTIGGDVRSVPAAQADALARITRESVNNIVRHADRDSVCSISVAVTPGAVLATFTNAASGPVGRGMGIDGMAERARAMGGHFDAGRQAQAWVVEVALPYSPVG